MCRLLPVGPDVGGVVAEGDGDSVGLGVAESRVVPAPDGTDRDAELVGEDGSWWVCAHIEHGGEWPTGISDSSGVGGGHDATASACPAVI